MSTLIVYIIVEKELETIEEKSVFDYVKIL